MGIVIRAIAMLRLRLMPLVLLVAAIVIEASATFLRRHS